VRLTKGTLCGTGTRLTSGTVRTGLALLTRGALLTNLGIFATGARGAKGAFLDNLDEGTRGTLL